MNFTNLLWAKRGNDLWLSLPDHLRDAAFTMKILLKDFVNPVLAQEFHNPNWQKTLVFLAAVHDLGKATPVFQTKLDNDEISQKILAGLQTFDASLNPHNYSHRRVYHAKMGGVLLSEAGFDASLCDIVSAHHGFWPEEDFDVDDELFDYGENYTDASPLWLRAQKELIDQALAVAEINQDDLAIFDAKESLLASGLITLADWLASSLPLTTYPHTRPFTSPVKTSNVKLAASDLYQFLNFQPSPMQKTVHAVFTQNPDFTLIEAPMGTGKTEMALDGFNLLSRARNLTGFYFALPTRATANAAAGRVNHYLDSFTHKPNLGLIHGKAQFNKLYQTLNPDIIANPHYNFQQIQVGTIDHVLTSVLRQKHLDLQMLSLTQGAVIIDEIHSFSDHMDSYLLKLLSWCGALHLPVIALSATLSSAKRQVLLNAYNGRRVDLTSNTYPAVTFLKDGEATVVPLSCAEKSVKIVKCSKSDQELLDFLTNAPGRVAYIVNTVARAQALGQILSRKRPVLVFHSRFTDLDREKIEEAVLSMPANTVVIGTQVLEQSLDLDFDYLITDLAPIDSLLQRIGRLHRHRRVRLKEFETPTCLVVERSDLLATDQFIYGDLLAKTSQVLPSTLTIPTDLRTLLDAVYPDFTVDTRQASFQIPSPANFTTCRGLTDFAKGRVREGDSLEVTLLRHAKVLGQITLPRCLSWQKPDLTELDLGQPFCGYQLEYSSEFGLLVSKID